MAWFLIVICRRFAPLCRHRNDNERAEFYEQTATDLLSHTQKAAWADSWYLRGYFDDGSTLGAPGNEECEIDLNAQTWSVFADATDTHASVAMQAVHDKLLDRDHRLIKLLAPPFEKIIHDPGYIRSYPPGVRENGGQYSHAAVWAAWAAVEMNDAETALQWFSWINPLNRSKTQEDIEHYRLEPYVMAGDIYGADKLAGMGGWSWYTGSAAWLYRLAIRKLLGLQRCGNRLYVRPCLPPDWKNFEATFNYYESSHHLNIHDPHAITAQQIFIVKDGALLDTPYIPLEKTGVHTYEVFASDPFSKRA